jgi:hypothetical protein
MLAVYVGAGDDVSPAIVFPHIKTFIYVDSQPLTEYGGVSLRPEYERPNFPKRVTTSMNKHGFFLGAERKCTEPYVYYNKQTLQKIKYYMNCCFPNCSERLLRDIKRSSILICCGHNPCASIIKCMKDGTKTFIGNNITCYDGSKDDGYRTVDEELLENPSLMDTYLRFDVIEKNSGYDVSSKSVSWHKNIIDLYKNSRI